MGTFPEELNKPKDALLVEDVVRYVCLLAISDLL